MPTIIFFRTQAEFRKWLEKHHDSASEVLVGFYKKASGKKSINYAQALDEALCFGWIDSIARRIDEESYSQRFTPRKPRSIWSNINIKHVERLMHEGKMMPAGIKAFEARDSKRTGVYSFENKPHTLTPAFEKKLKANKKAWKFFDSQPPGYKRTAIFWVMSAKLEVTREKRLRDLIKDSAEGLRIKPLRRDTDKWPL